jgi:hypothetical protein
MQSITLRVTALRIKHIVLRAMRKGREALCEARVRAVKLFMAAGLSFNGACISFNNTLREIL